LCFSASTSLDWRSIALSQNSGAMLNEDQKKHSM